MPAASAKSKEESGAAPRGGSAQSVREAAKASPVQGEVTGYNLKCNRK